MIVGWPPWAACWRCSWRPRLFTRAASSGSRRVRRDLTARCRRFVSVPVHFGGYPSRPAQRMRPLDPAPSRRPWLPAAARRGRVGASPTIHKESCMLQRQVRWLGTDRGRPRGPPGLLPDLLGLTTWAPPAWCGTLHRPRFGESDSSCGPGRTLPRGRWAWSVPGLRYVTFVSEPGRGGGQAQGGGVPSRGTHRDPGPGAGGMVRDFTTASGGVRAAAGGPAEPREGGGRGGEGRAARPVSAVAPRGQLRHAMRPR